MPRVTIHGVRALSKVLGHIARNLPSGGARPVLHWFTGTAAEARRAIDLGCYFSINPEMLRSPKHRAMVSELPLERLLTETDGPFVEADGRPIRPRNVAGTVAKLAALRTTSAEAMARQIVSNLAALVAPQPV